MKAGAHANQKLQSVYNKYGSPVFNIELYADPEDLTAYEQYYIDSIYGTPRCLNLNPKAEKPFYMKGYKHTEATRAKLCKIRKGQLGRPHTEAAKAKLSAAMKGRKLTEEHRLKIVDSLTGRQHSEATKEKMSINNACHRQEVRDKIAEALRGQSKSEEHKRKISEARKGKPLSEETKQKIRDGHARRKALKCVQS
jgi:group I intron endonuclease